MRRQHSAGTPREVEGRPTEALATACHRLGISLGSESYRDPHTREWDNGAGCRVTATVALDADGEVESASLALELPGCAPMASVPITRFGAIADVADAAVGEIVRIAMNVPALAALLARGYGR